MQLDIFEMLGDTVNPHLKQDVKALNCKLIIWAYEYYQLDNPSRSDAEYDGVYQEYLSKLKETSYRPFNDMSMQVGPPSRMAYHAALHSKDERR